MPVQSSQLVPLASDDVPREVRPWVEQALVVPLNRILDLFRTLLNRGISIRTHVNAQVIERKFSPPSSDPDITVTADWSASKLDTPSTLSGACLGVQVLACWLLDGAGHDSTPVGSLPSPIWREVVINGQRHIRLVYQYGLTAGSKYRLVLLAWGQ